MFSCSGLHNGLFYDLRKTQSFPNERIGAGMKNAYLKPNERNDLDALNMLRVIATFMVYMFHTLSASGFYIKVYYILGKKWVVAFNTPAWAGVWILFILSGYLAGKSFAYGRYKYTGSDIKRYYLTRIKKTYIPTMAYIFVFSVFVNPSWLINNPKVLLQMLLLVYNGKPGLSGQGHLWFVFTVMMLYLIVPLASYVMDKISKKAKPEVFLVLVIIIAIAGFFYRNLAHKNGLDWYKHIYTSAYGNLDLFLCGLIFSFYTKNRKEGKKPIRVTAKIIISAVLIAFIEYNCYIAFRSRTNLYRYVFPTVYVVICLMFFLAFDYDREKKNVPPTLKNIRHNPLRIIDWFSGISLYFYIFHSIVYNKYKMIMVDRTLPYFILYLLFVLVGATVLGYGFSRIFRYKKKQKVKASESDQSAEDTLSVTDENKTGADKKTENNT